MVGAEAGSRPSLVVVMIGLVLLSFTALFFVRAVLMMTHHNPTGPVTVYEYGTGGGGSPRGSGPV
jgi:hypothetical protein